MKKRKKVYFCLSGIIICYIIIFAVIAIIVSTVYDYEITKQISLDEMIFVLVICSVCIVGVVIISRYGAGNMILSATKIRTKLKGWNKYDEIDVCDIKEVVIDMQSIYSPTSSAMALRVNSRYGVLLGEGFTALHALLKTYPTMKFRVMYIGYRLGRKNAIMLAQRGCISLHKRQKIAKRFLIREEKLQPIEQPKDRPINRPKATKK